MILSVCWGSHLISNTKCALSAHLFIHGLEVTRGKHHLPQPALLGTCSGPAPCYPCNALPGVGHAFRSDLKSDPVPL